MFLCSGLFNVHLWDWQNQSRQRLRQLHHAFFFSECMITLPFLPIHYMPLITVPKMWCEGNVHACTHTNTTQVSAHTLHCQKYSLTHPNNWNQVFQSLPGPQVYESKHLGMQTVSTNICERMCCSQELSESQHGIVIGCHLCSKSSCEIALCQV